MAREIVFAARCDLCGDEARNLDVQVTLGLPGRANHRQADRSRRLDLCGDHYDALIAPLAKILDALPDPTQRQYNHRQGRLRFIGPLRCLVEDCASPPLKNGSTLVTHLDRWHGMKMADYVERYGELVALTEEEVAATVVEVTCPDCPKVYSTKLGHRWPARALHSHRIAAHGLLAGARVRP